MPKDAYHELLYVRRHYLHADALRNAIAHVANAIFRIRAAHIWGEGTTACASDAKHFGAWDQNLLTEWHLRYGGCGVMVYWHVEKRTVCIYSQLKTVSSSEVATMLEGLLRHGTEMPGVLVKRGQLTRPPFGVLQTFGTSRVPGPLPIAETPPWAQAQSLALGMCQS